MIGLEVICREFRLQNKDVAAMIGVSPGTFNDWLSGRRNIPESRIDQLSNLNIFIGIPKEYFQKELEQYERLNIESIGIMYQNNLTKNGDIFVDSEGNIDEGITNRLQFNEGRIKFLKAIEKLRNATIMNWGRDRKEWIELMDYYTETINLLAELFGRDNEEEKESVLKLLQRYSHVVEKEITIDKATHWIATKIEPYCVNRIILGKPYRIFYDKKRDEYYMFDEQNSNSAWFLTVEGRYAVIPLNKEHSEEGKKQIHTDF